MSEDSATTAVTLRTAKNRVLWITFFVALWYILAAVGVWSEEFQSRAFADRESVRSNELAEQIRSSPPEAASLNQDLTGMQASMEAGATRTANLQRSVAVVMTLMALLLLIGAVLSCFRPLPGAMVVFCVPFLYLLYLVITSISGVASLGGSLGISISVVPLCLTWIAVRAGRKYESIQRSQQTASA